MLKLVHMTAGLAWSDLGPVPRTMRQDVFELHTLLKKAVIKEPYILVGHSIGGLLARLYCQTYLSSNSKMIVADKSGHHVQLDQPEIIISAVKQMCVAIRKGTKFSK